MPKKLDISVIIPSNHGHHELLNIVDAVCNQTAKPAQIIIVDSVQVLRSCPNEILVLCAKQDIELLYRSVKSAFPGAARNIGLGLAVCEFIAFIDVQTIPHPRWLETSLSQVARHGAAGVWGGTRFSAQSRFESLVRDSFYGVLPRKTLPGAVIRREVFIKAGQFIDWVRAGEDTEWMLRLKVLKIPIINSSDCLIDYIGLIGLSMGQMLKKWRRNYTSSRDLPNFFPQKLLLWLVIYPLLVLIAFNWNYLIADWQVGSPLYIGHVTKAIVLMPVLIYVIARGIVLPLQRGVKTSQLFPIRFLNIIIVCFIADLVKFWVFALPKPKYDSPKNKF